MIANLGLFYLISLLLASSDAQPSPNGCNGCKLQNFKIEPCDGQTSGKVVIFSCSEVDITNECNVNYNCTRGTTMPVTFFELSMKGKMGDIPINVHKKDACKDLKEETKEKNIMDAITRYGADNFKCDGKTWPVETVSRNVPLTEEGLAAFGKSPGEFMIETTTSNYNNDPASPKDCVRMTGNIVCESKKRQPKKH